MSNLFREIHKNAWLKRVNTDKRLPVTKKSEKFWVVFCVHDDFEALLEGYQEPRFAALHQPDWTLSLKTTQHISHALVPTESDYEFVITLSSTAARFTASSWDTMQEWVSTLRSKLREMKIISPKENLYSRLPEIKQPLLPTRDPMSPLPPPPPVPAAIVPGIEATAVTNHLITVSRNAESNGEGNGRGNITEGNATETQIPQPSAAIAAVIPTPSVLQSPPSTAMSNTLTQNLLNMLSDPMANLTNRLISEEDDFSENEEDFGESFLEPGPSTSTAAVTARIATGIATDSDSTSSCSSASSSLARTFTTNVLHHHSPHQTNGMSRQNQSNGGVPRMRRLTRGESTTSSDSSKSSVGEGITPLVIPRPHTNTQATATNTAIPGTSSSNGNTTEDLCPEELNEGTASTNITIIQVSDPVIALGDSPVRRDEDHNKNTFMANIEVNGELQTNAGNAGNPLNTTQTVLVTTPNPILSTTTTNIYDEMRNLETGVTNISVGAILIQPPINNTPGNGPSSPVPVNPTNSTYEQVFLGDRNNNSGSRGETPGNAPNPPSSTSVNDRKPMPYSVFLLSRQQRSVSHVELTSPQRNRIQVNATLNEVPMESVVTIPVNGNSSENNSVPLESQEAKSNSTANSPPPNNNNSRPIVSTTTTNGNGNTNPNANDRASRQRRTPASNPALEQVNSPSRRRSSSSGEQHRNGHANAHGQNSRIVSPLRPPQTQQQLRNGNRPHPHPHAPPVVPIPVEMQRNGVVRMSLREQQVVQMRREIVHPGGVRLKFRKKDCLSAIALVDAFNSVWIAGWKQKEYLMRNNVLHIGDRLVSVAGIPVGASTGVAEVHKIMRGSAGEFVELIVRRVPFGRIYAIRREMDGQCLGLIRENNTATIIDVIPNGLAARHGLPGKAKSCDGLSLTFWVLTEINGRPLNLFFKDSEVQDRLNAVGRDISILVQPLDLVQKLKKQLKAMRGYKEFIVQ